MGTIATLMNLQRTYGKVSCPVQLRGGSRAMAGICEGRIVIVTGAGRGIGRAHALAFAREGAKVVVNDLGVARDGTGQDTGPAQQLVDEIVAAGGEAVGNTDDIADWNGAHSLVHTAIDT